mgnify:CR=1 FL=1
MSQFKDQLPIMEAFNTIQGEGYHQGKAAYFIRIAGCDVGCVWCDVKESWPAEQHPIKKNDEIVEPLNDIKTNIVVITGGEPLMYDLKNLTRKIKTLNKKTHIETSGAHPLTGTWDWICLSPKKFKAPLPQLFEVADELKIIVFNKNDLKWAETNAAKVSPKCKLYLQPEWSKKELITPLIIDYVKENPQWEISLQIHKYLNVA